MIKKADLILIIIIVLLAVGLWTGLKFFYQAPGGVAVVLLDGKEYGRYDLARDNTVSLPGADGGYNLMVIANHYAMVTDADCPDGFCVRQRHISRRGESIICLPHRLVIRIEQGGEGAWDGITY